jgi:hypothetical protein
MTVEVARSFAQILARSAAELGSRDPGAGNRLAAGFGILGFLARNTGDGRDEALEGARLLAGIIESTLFEAAVQISRALSVGTVPHFFVKGIALSGRAYRSGDREMADIDLHVMPSLWSRAVNILSDLGYTLLPPEEQDGPAALRAGVALQRGSAGSEITDIAVDLRWGLDPVNRLLPRPDLPVPQTVWRDLDRTGPIPVPSDHHHAALIVHHLVHHDMLHVRGLLDLALLWSRLLPEGGRKFEDLARELGVLRASRMLGKVLVKHFDLSPCGLEAPPDDVRSRRALALLEPVRWCCWAARASESEFVEITWLRVRRRLLFLDSLRSVPALVQDAVLPPREYLRWRWPYSRSAATALGRHLSRVIAKTFVR